MKQVIVYNCLISPIVYRNCPPFKTFRPVVTEANTSSQIIFEFILHYSFGSLKTSLKLGTGYISASKAWKNGQKQKLKIT